ncbi:MAG: P-II family nitrogen regulator [Deltaproteobacteria bacterium]|nr:P-II family nitrogen regulator [Deltaproteobacteria bacterium]
MGGDRCRRNASYVKRQRVNACVTCIKTRLYVHSAAPQSGPRSAPDAGTIPFLSHVNGSQVVKDEDKDFVIKTVIHAARTGSKGAYGDGKIFVVPVDEVYTISSGMKETGSGQLEEVKI